MTRLIDSRGDILAEHKDDLGECLRSELARAKAEGHPIAAPRVDGGVWTAWVQTGTEDAPQWTLVHIDPCTAERSVQRSLASRDCC